MKTIIAIILSVVVVGCASPKKVTSPMRAAFVQPQRVLHLTWEQNYQCENCTTIVYHSNDLTVPIAQWPVLIESSTATNVPIYPDLVPVDFFVAQNSNTVTGEVSDYNQ